MGVIIAGIPVVLVAQQRLRADACFTALKLGAYANAEGGDQGVGIRIVDAQVKTVGTLFGEPVLPDFRIGDAKLRDQVVAGYGVVVGGLC